MLQVRDRLARVRIRLVALGAIGVSVVALAMSGAYGAEEARGLDDEPLSVLAAATDTPSEAAPAALAAPAAPVAPPPPDEETTYAQAKAQGEGGAHAAAAAGYAEVRGRRGVLSGLAALRQGQALMRADQDGAALEPLSAAAGDPDLPAPLRLEAVRDGSVAAVRAGRRDEARWLLGRADELVLPGTAEATRMQWHAAKTLRDLGDPAWSERALAVVLAAPGSPEAPLALDALGAADVAVAPLAAALVRYRARDNARATALFQRALEQSSGSDETGRAWFYLGALAERAADDRSAIEAYSNSLQAAPAGALAPDALWWRGLLLADAGSTDAALADFDELVRAFPRSQFADDAALRAALLEHEQGRPAGGRLRAIVASGAGPEAARASRWLRVLGLRTDADGAPASFAPFSFAALLEEAGGDGTLPPAAAAEWDASAADWGPVDPWLRARSGEPPGGVALRDALAGTPLVLLARAMSRVGEHEAARLVWLSGVRAAGGSALEAVELGRMAAEAGFPDVGMLGAGYALAPLTDLERASAPPALLQLAYPVPYAEAVASAASAEGIPAFLLLALMRQESGFQVSARSPVGALGLTQVMPDTGRTIAASLRTEWRVESLTEPATSIRFGAHYLGQLLRRYDGNVLAALAGYNAGPGAADRWMRLSGGAPDAFYEAVDYSETRLYVERVLENYGAYRFMYGFAPRPGVW